MPTNRFDLLPQKQRYVSSYVPLPLDLISRVGATKQQNLDQSRNLINTSTDPFANLNLGTSLKYYDKQGHVVDSGDIGLNDIKNQAISSLSSERQKLASDLATGKITDYEFNNLASQHYNKAKNVYNQLSAQQNVVKTINDYNKELAANKEFATNKYYGTDLLKYNTEWLNNAKRGVISPYNPPSVAGPYNMQKAALDFKFRPEGTQQVSIGDYIFKHGEKGVTPERVHRAASLIASDKTSEVSQYNDMLVRHQLELYGLSGNEDASIRVPVGKDKSGKTIYENKKTTLYNKLMMDQANKFVDTAIAQHAGIERTEDVKSNPWAIFNAKGREQKDLLWGLSSVQGENKENYDLPDFVNKFVSNGKIDINKKPSEDVLSTTIGEFEQAIEAGARGTSKEELYNEAKQQLIDWADNQSNKLNIKQGKDESYNDFLNKVVEETKIREQNVLINRSLSPVSDRMDKLLIGDGSKFIANYDDILDPETGDPVPVDQFIEDSNINPETISHGSLSFDKKHPGYILFTAKDNDDNLMKFYAKSRDLNLSQSMKPVVDVVNIFKDFYSSNDKYKKVSANGKSFTIVKDVGEDDNVREYAATNSNNEPIILIVDKKTDKIAEVPIEKLKSDALYGYLNSSFGTIFSTQRDSQNYQFKD